MMKTTTKLLLSILALVALQPALADPPGCIPVFRQTTITSPGNYCVTRNIAVFTGPVVDVQADDVNLYLNGYTLEVTGAAGNTIDIGGAAGTLGTVRVTEGRVRGGVYGVNVLSGSPRNVALDTLTIVDPASEGIHVESARIIAIEEVMVSGAPGAGISVTGDLAHPSNVLVRSSRVLGSGGSAIVVSVPSWAHVIGNEIDGFGGGSPGIHVINGRGSTRYMIVGNSVIDGTGSGAGIRLGTGFGTGTIFGNLVTGNGSNGMWIESGTARIVDNHVTDNSSNGMIVGGRNAHIEDNTIENNSLYGLTCAGLQGHVYTSNVIRGNTSGPVDPAGCEFSLDGGGNIY